MSLTMTKTYLIKTVNDETAGAKKSYNEDIKSLDDNEFGHDNNNGNTDHLRDNFMSHDENNDDQDYQHVIHGNVVIINANKSKH